MSRIPHRLISGALFLAAALVLAGAFLYSTHAHFVLADSGTYQWVQIDPPAGTPDGPANLIDMGWGCTNTTTCDWAACGPGDPAYAGTACDSVTCTGGGFGGTFFAYEHAYQCQYTPPSGPSCTPDSSCRANTCTTNTCDITNGDCSRTTVAGTKSCTPASASLSASPTSITSGNSSTLSYTCSPAAPANILPDIGTLPSPAGSGSVSVSPSVTTTYTLNCFEPTSVVSSAATVAVTGAVPTCIPNASCAASTCSGSTCSDSCGNFYAGTNTSGSCAVPPGGGGPGGGGPGGGSCTSPAVSITASPARVASGQSVTLNVTGSGINTGCVVKDETGSTLATTPASSCTVSTTITTPPITAQKIFTVTCDGATATAKVIINLNPVFTPF